MNSPTLTSDEPTVRWADDWTLDYVDRGSLAARHARLLRSEAYPYTTEGGEWWGAMTPTGFGPRAVASPSAKADWSAIAPRSEAAFEINDESYALAAAVRDEAGMRPSGSWGYRAYGSTLYDDYIGAASVRLPEEDDLWIDGVWMQDAFEAEYVLGI